MSDVIRRLRHPPAAGARNMAVDEALMEAARAGRVTLRFYGWDPPCLSLGRNQTARDRYDPRAISGRGVDLVRRPTGGRAVYHHRELTYAITAPADRWDGLRASYRRINRALLRGLAGLGVDGREADDADRDPGRLPGPSARGCFRDPLPGEIVAGGRKLVGSAQWRQNGALLQHGSLLLYDDQAMTERFRLGDAGGKGAGPRGGRPTDALDGTDDLGTGTSPRAGGVTGAAARRETAASATADAGSGPSAAALSDLLGELPGHDELARALEAGFEAEFGLPVRSGTLDPDEEERAARLAERYRSDDWTWRR